MTTADRIWRIRARLGLTQRKFAKAVGVNFGTVNRWENGWFEPSDLAWEKLMSMEKRSNKLPEPDPKQRVSQQRDRLRDSRARKLRERGLTYAEIGRQLGISRQRVHQIVVRSDTPLTTDRTDPIFGLTGDNSSREE